MEENIIFIDDTGAQRNAVIVRRPAGNAPGGGALWNSAAGQWIRQPAPTAPPPSSYQQTYQTYAPPQVIQVAAPAKSSAKSWIPDLLDIFAAVSPLPAPPTASGDLAKDFANAMAYAGGLAASLKRGDMLHTAARIIEKRL